MQLSENRLIKQWNLVGMLIVTAQDAHCQRGDLWKQLITWVKIF